MTGDSLPYKAIIMSLTTGEVSIDGTEAPGPPRMLCLDPAPGSPAHRLVEQLALERRDSSRK